MNANIREKPQSFFIFCLILKHNVGCHSITVLSTILFYTHRKCFSVLWHSLECPTAWCAMSWCHGFELCSAWLLLHCFQHSHWSTLLLHPQSPWPLTSVTLSLLMCVFTQICVYTFWDQFSLAIHDIFTSLRVIVLCLSIWGKICMHNFTGPKWAKLKATMNLWLEEETTNFTQVHSYSVNDELEQ